MTTDPTGATEASRCTARTAKGGVCRAYGLIGSDPPQCFSHAEGAREARIAARSRGGRATHFAKGGAAVEIARLVESAATPAEVGAALAKVFAAVSTGMMPPRVGSTLAQVGAVALRAYREDLGARLERLQERLDDPRFAELKAAWNGEIGGGRRR